MLWVFSIGQAQMLYEVLVDLKCILDMGAH